MAVPSGPAIPAPIDEPSDTLSSYAQRAVLERGVVLDRVEPGLWQYRSKGAVVTARLADLTSELSLQIVRLGLKMNPSGHCNFIVAASPGLPVLEMQVQRIAQEQVQRVESRFARQVMNIGYIAEAMTYHCGQLIDRYLDVLDAVTNGGQDLDLFSDDFLSSGSVAPYFEFEALVTAAVRAYDTARFPLWTAYGSGGSPPTNFERVAQRISSRYPRQDSLTTAVRTYTDAKEYRDCVQHYAHFGARLPFTRVQLLKGKAWSALALLPDNPEAKSYDRFLYSQQIDALAFGWRVTNSVLIHLGEIVANLPMGGASV